MTNKILLVEDIYFNQVLIQSLLTDWGYDVILAENGSEALAKMQSEKPNLIVLDLMLPIMDGFKFLEEKRNIGINTPVIVLSARNDMESINKAISLGAVDYITKPFNSNDLSNKLEAFLQNDK
jgi:CheY-like chemotaxis protein